LLAFEFIDRTGREKLRPVMINRPKKFTGRNFLERKWLKTYLANKGAVREPPLA
jgi:hypothetical protein